MADNPPRVVAEGSLAGGTKQSAKSSALTHKFVAEGWQLAFSGAAFLTRDKEWEIEEEGDAGELADRTLQWVRSLDKKKAAELEKRLAKWQPSASLLFALVAIVGPRIKSTRDKRRAINLQAQRAATPSAPAKPATAPVTDSSVSSNGRGDATPGAAPTGPGQPNARLVPFGRQDYQELYNDSDH